MEQYPYGQLAGSLPYHIKDLTEQLLLSVQLGLRSLPESFLADVEIDDPQLGRPVRMADYLEQHASPGPCGPTLEGPDEQRRAIPLPGTGGPETYGAGEGGGE